MAWLVLKPLGIACQLGGAIAFFLVEKDFLTEHCNEETANELWTMLTPRLVVSPVLLGELHTEKQVSNLQGTCSISYPTVIRIIFWVVVFKYYKVVKSWGNSYDIGDRMTAMMFKRRG